MGGPNGPPTARNATHRTSLVRPMHLSFLDRRSSGASKFQKRSRGTIAHCRRSLVRPIPTPVTTSNPSSRDDDGTGKYWKTLSREEREVWEAKALVAQAEHRKRYPDWRFRPGANALAKLKVKDGPSPNRRRHSQSGRKTRPRGESNANKKSRDERCAVIADLLVEGKTGVDLEHAVKKWEDKNRGEEISADVERSEGHMGEGEHKNEGGILDAVEGGRTQTRSQTPDAVDTRFKIPLTAMFKRSLSAPASQSPENHQQHPLPSHTHTQVRQDSLQSVFANITYDTYDTPYKNIACGGGGDGVDQQHTDHVSPLDSIGDLSPLVPPCLLGEDPPAEWNDPYNLLETSLGAPPPPPSVRTQDCTYAHEHTHAHILSSPVATDPPFSSYDSPGLHDMHSFRPWSYTPVKHWADTCQPFTQMPIFINEFGGYGWGNGDMNGIDGGCDGTVGEGTYGTTPEHSPVEYTHTHTHAHAADEHYDAAELVRVFPGYAPATAKF
ncbi:hypothetical protein V8B97DRAFT_1987110 [Scleroderma yunnanense]